MAFWAGACQCWWALAVLDVGDGALAFLLRLAGGRVCVTLRVLFGDGWSGIMLPCADCWSATGSPDALVTRLLSGPRKKSYQC